nr:hypothetical protein [Tanacetum cinerariifolium]
MVIQNQSKLGGGLTMPTDPHYTLTILQPSTSQPQKTQKPKKPKRKNTQVPQPSGSTNNVADEAIYKELRDSLVRATIIASSLEVEQDSGDTTAQTRFESVSKHSNDSLLVREKTKTTQSNEIASLKRRVKKLKKKNKSSTHKLKRLYKVGLIARVESSDEESLGEDASKQSRRIDAIDQDEDNTPINVQDDAEMFDVDYLGGEEVFIIEQEIVSTAATTVTTEELTLAQALEALKTSKPKIKGIVIQEQEEPEILIRTDLVKGKEKRAGEELIQKSTKKQKMEDDKETAELKQLMKIISDKEKVAINAILLAVKSPRIVDRKIHKEGKKSYYQIKMKYGRSNKDTKFVSTAATAVTTKELTLAQALEALKTSKPKVKSIVIPEQREPGKSTTAATIPKQQSQDKGKGIMIKEPVKPKKKDQIRLDEEAAKRLQVEFNDKERLARKREL